MLKKKEKKEKKINVLKSDLDTMHFYLSFVLSSGMLSCARGLMDHHLNHVC